MSGVVVAAWWSLGQRGREDTQHGAPDKEVGGGEPKEHVDSKPVLLFSGFLVVSAGLETVSCEEAILWFCA